MFTVSSPKESTKKRSNTDYQSNGYQK